MTAKQTKTKPTPAVQPAPKPEPQVWPIADPLRAKLSGNTEEQESALRASLLVMALDWLSKAPVYELQGVVRFMRIIDNNDGCTTPAEEFILGLVMHHARFEALTPDTAADRVEEFRTSFESAVSVARRVAGQYPNVLLNAPE